jgi:hypothetical protein
MLKNANAKEAKMKAKRVLEEYFLEDLGREKISFSEGVKGGCGFGLVN